MLNRATGATLPLVMLLNAAPLFSATDVDFFENKVRPVLAGNCYSCHATSQLGGLRVDSREALLKGGISGPAVIPGDPDKSLLIQAVRQSSEKLKMPKGGKLKTEEIEALSEWIRTGAAWPAASATPASTIRAALRPDQTSYWAFQPLHKPEVPADKNPQLAKTEIDRFLLAALEKQGIQPVKPADRRTLLRRATLDLTGLPPTFEEIQSFLKDASPDAFAKVIDRLLASPRYGERWGRFWLDIARYGEDDYRSLDPMRRGFNPYPNAYLYRDWVIQAFNDDLPYNQFVTAQLAADLMDEKVRVRMMPALGFLGLGPWFYDNGAVEITRADERHDRVDVVSRGFLGLTLGCARCHDHKYDPISAKDYYSLAGVFANTVYTEHPLVPKSVVDEYKAKEKLVENKEKLLGEITKNEGAALSEGLALQASKYMLAAWKVTGEPKEEMANVCDDSKLDYELFDRWLKFLAKPPKFYPFLKSWQEMVKKGGSEEEAKKLSEEFQNLVLSVMFERKEITEENEIIAAKALPGTKKKKPSNLPNEFVTNDDFCPGCGLELKAMTPDRTNLWVDVFQRDLAEGFDPAQIFDRIKPGLLAFRGWGLEHRLSPERRAVVEALRADIKEAQKEIDPKYPYLHAVKDVEKPSNLRLNLRGNPFNLGEEAPRGFPAVLSGGASTPFTKGSGRLELAEAILKQPIAMRVIVNRIWKGHFGTGLVDSPSNFGVAAERPSNPDLLEYLAQSFVDNGMSIKKLHREMMLSSAYQLSTENSQPAFEKDSGNRLYWRANRKRMDAEEIRDSLLFVSGAIDLKTAGPSGDLTPGYNRRTVYGKVSRYRLDEYLQLFDFPSPNLSAEKRFTTTVPLQRLFFMNSDFVEQQAELLARRVEFEADNSARIRKTYQIVFGRQPTEEELKTGLEYLRTEPLQSYEERKAEKDKKAAAPKSKDAMPAAEPPPGSTGQAVAADAMMAGMGAGPRKKTDEVKLLPVTPFGRYAKALLSSGEFLYVE